MNDVLIVGGGVLGAFHAYHALEAGLKVTLLERDSQPQGATVRNFGQVVPSGMPLGKWRDYGIASTALYKKIQRETDISVREGGSVYIASDVEEEQLINEMHDLNRQHGYDSQLLTKAEVLRDFPAVHEEYARAALYYPQEVNVQPRAMVHRLLAYLVSKGLHYLPNHGVYRLESAADAVTVHDNHGQQHRASKVIICNGSDFKTLYPQQFAASDIEVVKLNMLETLPQPSLRWQASILTGLTIRRYECFHACPSFATLDKQHPRPDLRAMGIHLLFSQTVTGSVVIGDSHEYQDVKDADALGFALRADINQALMTEAKKIMKLEQWQLQHTWFGVYSQRKGGDIFSEQLEPNVHVVTAIGGKGMTGSAGFAREHIRRLCNA